ncbi:hypothetical protein RFI_32227 [Reticulomyxa filosa]|uniref:Rieske domain-containing protein n=1 Tax=Reticulomyxa filosa TaxID=46433 RepID=X6LTA4_RETFI|nr:hypothetical protein RFI_32227 [Reticulomyxa filosa]|eukprot:ETO05168.1 hypothetical protein RFI_32227 [Reticulomyxa filosa]
MLDQLKAANTPIKVLVSGIILSIIGAVTYGGVKSLESVSLSTVQTWVGQFPKMPFEWIGQGLFFTGLGIFLHYSYSRVLTSHKEKDEKVELRRDEMRSSTYPTQYPNGWYFLVYSKDIKKGQVKNVSALGQQFVVFRGESGAVGVLDAFCPHLGANLGVGGKDVREKEGEKKNIKKEKKHIFIFM